MALMENIIGPIIQLSIYMFFVFGFLFLLRYWIKKLFPNWRWWFKYSVFKRPYNEETVKLCMNMIDDGLDEIQAKKYFILKDQNLKIASEKAYIFNKTLNVLKGGAKNGR